MKKLICAFFATIIVCILTISAVATEDIPETNVEATETMGELVSDTTEQGDRSENEMPTLNESVPAETAAAEISVELDEAMIDKFITLAEELRLLKESDLGLKERLIQLVNSENLSSTLGTIMSVICGFAIFIFRSIQKKDSNSNYVQIASMKKELAEERELNKTLRADVDRLIGVIKENSDILSKINIDTTENRELVEIAKTATVATAKMVSDAFGHSRTIDSATKELLTHDYLAVLKAEEKDNE